MRLLLDTHTFLWYTGGKPELSSNARRLIEDPDNEKWVSIASAWEIAIKASLSKIELHVPFNILFPDQLDSSGFRRLAIRWEHLHLVSRLPLHHRDPFDRLLIAQSLTEQMPIVSVDAALDAYGVTRLW